MALDSETEEMPSPYFPSQLLLAHDQVELGDLVLSKDTPWNDFRPYPKRLHPHVDFASSTQQINEVLANISGGQLGGNVGNLFKAAIASSQTSAQAMQAMQSNCVRLKNSGDKFENDFLGTDDIVGRATGRAIFGQIADTNVKRWLEKQMIERNRQAYMIVGIYTLSDAQIAQVRSMAQAGGMEFNAPEPANLGARGGAGQLAVREGAIIAPGNQIYALEYRQVRLKRHILSGLRKDKIEDAYLSKTNVWKLYGGGEGQRVDLGDETNEPSVPEDEDEDDSEEYLEADLVDELDPLDIEEIEV